MEYRQCPHGTPNEKFSVPGLGLGCIGQTAADEIEAIIRKAIDQGICFFGMCTGCPFGVKPESRMEAINLCFGH